VGRWLTPDDSVAVRLHAARHHGAREQRAEQAEHAPPGALGQVLHLYMYEGTGRRAVVSGEEGCVCNVEARMCAYECVLI
jgi:hypothetical protein